jgi:hypothetical protein
MIKGQYDQKAYDSSIPGASGVGGQPSTPSTETDSSVNTEETKDPKTDVAPPADKQVGVSPQNNADALIGYDQQIAMLENEANGLKPETEEERKKRERREKSQKIVAAVSDGLQALSNLFFTTRGAPNMYDHDTNGQLSPLQTKLDKLKAERQANADKYLQYSLKIGDLRNERAKTLREMEAEQEKRKLAREKAQREQEEHGWLAALQPDKLREQKGKADKAGYDADTAKAEADNAPAMQKAKLETEKAHKDAYVASAGASRAAETNSYASANEHNTNARGRFQWWDENGNMHYAKTEDEAITKARQHGTLDSVTVSTTDSTDSDVVVRGKVKGKKNSKKTTSKKVFYPGIRKRPAAAKPSGRKSEQQSYKNTKELGY